MRPAGISVSAARVSLGLVASSGMLAGTGALAGMAGSVCQPGVQGSSATASRSGRGPSVTLLSGGLE